jgi:photosystem II stability/assembly factor-like uncharacterized protein
MKTKTSSGSPSPSQRRGTIRSLLRQLAILSVLFAVSAALRAGVNTWTGGGPMEFAPRLLASDPSNPDVVYGIFGSDLHRSVDGGRTWSRLRAFYYVQALLVHPASPSTIYVADIGAPSGSQGVYRSTDGGETWSLTLEEYAMTLAGSPTDPSSVFVGSPGKIHRTTDGGATWSRSTVTGAISSLLLHPLDPAVAYAGAEAFDYWGYNPGFLGRTDDAGTSWQPIGPPPLQSVLALGIDPAASSTIYAATGWRADSETNPIPDVLRSDDGGASWAPAAEGLPGGGVRRLAVDPIAGTLYGATATGIYRSRDGGRSWTAFGQRLAGTVVESLAIARDGLRLHAATSQGVYDLEPATGPVDVAAEPRGGSRVLVWEADRRAVGALDTSGRWTSTPFNDSSSIWTAIAIAAGESDRAHVLWQSGDGRSALEIVGTAGRQSARELPSRPGWIASDLSMRADGQTNVLWTGTDGSMFIARVDASGAESPGPAYGPFLRWSAVSIADGPDGKTWVLWRSTDGREGLSLHKDGTLVSPFQWPADPGWAVEDIAVGADGRPRVLRTASDGSARLATFDAAGRLTADQLYRLEGFAARRIAAGADGRTRLLFSGADGRGELLLLKPDNTLNTRYRLETKAGITVATSAELEAALAPANAGRRILVRAGEYEIRKPLTVPDRATLVGEGVMEFDESGLPTGIALSGRTSLRSTPDLVGDILTLGDGAALRDLRIEDFAGRSGNPIVVSSRSERDSVFAEIEACEIINPNLSGITPQGPTGRGLVVITRNPNLGQDPPAHEGATVRVRMRRSVVRSPGGGIGVFAINFASHAAIRLFLERNVVGGGLNASGGVSRPDAVTGASTVIESERNLYRSDSAIPTETGWNLIGGTTAPIPGLASQASTFNSLGIHSRDDRVDAFVTGIFAVGGLRTSELPEPSSSNSVDMDLRGTGIRTPDVTGAADLTLFGAMTFVNGVPAGDGNTLRLQIRDARGSGLRRNQYADSWSPSMENLGIGNGLRIGGSQIDFIQNNPGLDPPPPAEFFTAKLRPEPCHGRRGNPGCRNPD